MSYIRTEDIKAKQRAKMIEISKGYNHQEIDRKRKATIKERGIKVGRPKGCLQPTNHWFIKCKCCDNQLKVIPSNASTRKYCSRSCQKRDPDYITMLKNIDRSYTQTPEFSRKQSKPDTPAYKRYKNKVHRLSEKVYKENKSTINPQNYPRTRAGIADGYQLDHIKPINQCFIECISEEEASQLSNLRIVS